MPSTDENRQKALNAAYGAAMKRLKENNLDEFNGYMREEAKVRKQDWSPKPTAEQKAEAELRALLEANPALAGKVPEILGQPSLPEGEAAK